MWCFLCVKISLSPQIIFLRWGFLLDWTKTWDRKNAAEKNMYVDAGERLRSGFQSGSVLCLRPPKDQLLRCLNCREARFWTCRHIFISPLHLLSWCAQMYLIVCCIIEKYLLIESPSTGNIFSFFILAVILLNRRNANFDVFHWWWLCIAWHSPFFFSVEILKSREQLTSFLKSVSLSLSLFTNPNPNYCEEACQLWESSNWSQFNIHKSNCWQLTCLSCNMGQSKS